ncbi:DUF3000 domain-containing protein [Natronosporangium hydrolyticum]|uniref:DUF3000 domain-containing protein n=1 Tax=Natronosporangium hydrolyticum TaxID=2811111 RepID=A0A895YN90_9ACTN|nr:DUF3000 domain-containing protein [Natronosporangium hydrolyticum]QSB16166.1 DUF3000 domain-containing protein [Natronosporangium hydrolyticum]
MAPSAVVPDTFSAAVAALGSVPARSEITITELPAPQKLAPYTYALGAAVRPPAAAEVASGRLILLYDPAGQVAWQGEFRLVTYVTAELEPDLAADQLLPEVGWSWLTDALAGRAPNYTALAGTVTQTISTRFGDLTGPPPAADLEIRASWTPVGGGLDRHFSAWCALLASAAGLPPPGVSALTGRLTPLTGG